MAKPTLDYTLYLVTDRDLMSSPTLSQAVEQACRGGVTLVQLREKHCAHDEYVRIAKKIKPICDANGVGLIVDDAPEVCVEADCAGVHVGQDDLPAGEVRKIVGPDRIIGVSVGTVDEALEAQARGADYLGIGAMTFTPTKPDARVVSHDEARAICKAVDIPCVVIGGINEQSIPSFAGYGLAGYAIVSGIIAAPDIEAAARRCAEAIAGNREHEG